MPTSSTGPDHTRRSRHTEGSVARHGTAAAGGAVRLPSAGATPWGAGPYPRRAASPAWPTAKSTELAWFLLRTPGSSASAQLTRICQRRSAPTRGHSVGGVWVSPWPSPLPNVHGVSSLRPMVFQRSKFVR
jgi:hypothetical protein